MPSKKVLAAKKQIVTDLSNEFKQAQSIVFTDYRGLTVEQDTILRTALRKAEVNYQVVKNTLSGRALKESGIEGIEEFLKGPTAIAYSTKDVVSPAKIIKEYADKYEKLTIKGGAFEGKAIQVSDVNALAKIPSKEVLYGQVVFGLIAPIASLAILLNAIKEKAEAGSTDAVTAPVVAENIG